MNKTIVMNLKNLGVTEYEDFEFNSFCYFNGAYYGANSSGIFMLEGDKDGTANIDASFKTGKTDIGIDNQKIPVDVYVTVKGDGGYRYKTLTGENTEYFYDIHGREKYPHTVKANLSRGIKERFIGTGFANSNGSDFEVQSIKLNVDVLKGKK